MAKLKETNVREDLYVKGDIYVYDFNLSRYRSILDPATEQTLGTIIVGNNLTISPNGTLSAVLQPVDPELGDSANPVENRAVFNALKLKVDTSIVSENASIDNVLVDKQFVLDQVKAIRADFRGTFANFDSVPTSTSGSIDPHYEADDDGNRTPKKGDYIIITDASDYVGDGKPHLGTWQFIYSGIWDTSNRGGWKPTYAISNIEDLIKSMTKRQQDALNSGINSDLVKKYNNYELELQSKANAVHSHIAAQVSGLSNIALAGQGTWFFLDNIPTAGNSSTPIYFGLNSAGKVVPTACAFEINVPITTDILALSEMTKNGWYTYNGVINSEAGPWKIQRIDNLYLAYNTRDPRIVFNSNDRSNWVSPYGSWHA